MKRIQTQYPHQFNPDGSRLSKPCAGLLHIVCHETTGVFVICSECAQAYRLHIKIEGNLSSANTHCGF